MELLLNCESLTKTYGPRTLFAGISLSLFEGERAGLIGPNGSGKSTLMKILCGDVVPDSGQVVSRRKLRYGYVAQEDRFAEDATVESVLADALAGEHLPDRERLAAIAQLAGKMGFDDRSQLASTMSGGWRKRLAIARALIQKPDLLLLDEPTNHLDVEGIQWLEEYLIDSSLTVLVVTHDRYFLENVTNRVIELNRAFPDGYFSTDANYSTFIQKRDEFLEAQRSEQASLASRVRREVEWLRRGAKARTTKAKGRIQEAARMMSELADLKSRNAAGGRIAVDFSATGRQTRKLVAARKVAKSMGGQQLFEGLSFVISPRDRLGIVGPNGSGKTTLLRLITGELQPDAGEVQRADDLRIVFFQQQRDLLDRSMSLREALAGKGDLVVYEDKPIHVSGWAQRFLFRKEQLDQPLGDLSGGERARVLIAQLMLRPADILVMDEPTNDLDIPSLEVLEDSLDEFSGAVVLVTHDRYMIDRLCTSLVGLDGFGGAGVFAELSQWEAARETAAEADRLEREAQKQKQVKAAEAVRPAAKKKLTWNEQREWETIEQRIADAEDEVKNCHLLMEDPAVLRDPKRLDEACREMDAAQKRVHELYARWEELELKQA